MVTITTDENREKGCLVVVPSNRPYPNIELCAESLERDTPADTLWFAEHPGERTRVRPPTPLEIAAWRLPPDAEAVVFEDSPGKHIRGFRGKGKKQ